MILSAIVAVSENNAIGVNNQLPWHLPDDLKFFKRTTLGKPVLMGRKTYDSLGKPLVNRLNVVISRTDVQLPEGVVLVHSIEDGIKRIKQEATEEGFILGGGIIFEQTMNIVDRLYITRVHTHLDGADTFFPDIEEGQWKLVWEEHHPEDEKHKYSFTFQQWDRL